MDRLFGIGFTVIAALLLSAAPARAQIPVVVHGRIEDAVTRAPVEGATVLSADSSTSVLTAADGTFAIELQQGSTISVHVERIGFLSQSFDLPAAAAFRVSVLLLEPAPILLEGVEAVGITAIEEILDDLNHRRNFYPGSLFVFDRERLHRFMPVGTVWDLIRQRYSGIFECNVGLSGLCVRGRSRSFANPNPQVPVLVCVDAWESWGAASELANMDVSTVSLVEIYGRGRGGIRVYTARYLLDSARNNRFIAPPLEFGC